MVGLPIECYNSKFLTCIGNTIGKTIKVNKNTLTQEQGKYAWLCVEVDLTKPLLAMFAIKGSKYRVEYEGLHFLCINCGRFRHYKEEWHDKDVLQRQNNENVSFGNHYNAMDRASGYGNGIGEEGPWKMV